MQAVIKTGGKQYIVKKGTELQIEKIEGEAGSSIEFDQVLLVGEENAADAKIGTPFLDGAKVIGKILDQEKGKKVTVFKYKRRKGYHKKQGHRQELTRVEIQEIQA